MADNTLANYATNARQLPQRLATRTAELLCYACCLLPRQYLIDRRSDGQLAGIEQLCIGFLLQLLTLLHNNPMTTGQLLEQWRGTKEGEGLARLAALDEVTAGENILEELEDTCAYLIDLFLQQRMAELQHKASNGGLSQEEKQELLLLLSETKQKNNG